MEGRQIFVVFIAVMFVSSTVGYAFFQAPQESSERYDDVNYSEYPPTNGPRANEFLEKNIFEEEVPEPVQVNMLTPREPSDFPNRDPDRVIGGVWIQYSCNDCPQLVSKLTQITETYKPRVYLAPYSNMDSKIALTAYYESKKMEEFNQTAIEDFICENLRYGKPDRCALRESYS